MAENLRVCTAIGDIHRMDMFAGTARVSRIEQLKFN